MDSTIIITVAVEALKYLGTFGSPAIYLSSINMNIVVYLRNHKNPL